MSLSHATERSCYVGLLFSSRSLLYSIVVQTGVSTRANHSPISISATSVREFHMSLASTPLADYYLGSREKYSAWHGDSADHLNILGSEHGRY